MLTLPAVIAAERWTHTSNTKTLEHNRARLTTAVPARSGCLTGEVSTTFGVRDQALFWKTNKSQRWNESHSLITGIEAGDTQGCLNKVKDIFKNQILL